MAPKLTDSRMSSHSAEITAGLRGLHQIRRCLAGVGDLPAFVLRHDVHSGRIDWWELLSDDRRLRPYDFEFRFGIESARDDYHLRNVTLGEDFQAEIHDLRQVTAGDLCPHCAAPLAVVKTIELGHIFKLGCKYSESMGLRVLGADGREVTPVMGSYGIGIERVLTCAIEISHDKDGMILPPAIAPFQVVVTPANNSDPEQAQTARAIYDECLSLGLDALLDDRDERPGVKFKDADLIGIPWRVVVGKKLASGLVELVERKTRQTTEAPPAEAAKTLKARL